MKAKYLPVAVMLFALTIGVGPAHAVTAGLVQTTNSGNYPGPSMPGVHHLTKGSPLMAGETLLTQAVTTAAADENTKFTMNCPSATKVAGFVAESTSGSSLPSDDGNWGGNPGITSLVVTLHGVGTSNYYLLCDNSMVYKFDTFRYAVPPVHTPDLGAWILPPGKRTTGKRIVVGTYLDVDTSANVDNVLVRITDSDGKRVYQARFTGVKYGGGPMVTRSVKVALRRTYKVEYFVKNVTSKPSIQRRAYKTRTVK